MIDPVPSAQSSALDAIRRGGESLARAGEALVSGEGDLAEAAVQVRIDSAGIRFAVAALEAADENTRALLDLFA